MILPTDPAVLVCVAKGRSGWSGYDRGIRDHLADARPGDPQGWAYWTHRALTLAWLDLAGSRWQWDADLFAAAQAEALVSLRPLCSEQAWDYAAGAVRQRQETAGNRA